MITDTKLTQQGVYRPIYNGKTQKVMDLITNHGIEPKEALTLIDGEIPSPSRVSRLKEKVRKYSLSAPKMVKLAHQAVKETLQMKPIEYEAHKAVPGVGVVDYTDTLLPSITNRLAAAAMVLDRDQPIVKVSVNANMNADIDPVDLALFMGGGRPE